MTRLPKVAFALALTLTGQDSSPLQRLTIGKTPTDKLNFSEPGRTWNLGPFNRTTEISAAYRYKNDVVIFGFVERAGLTTIIDAATGEEQLEFLSWEPLITSNGLILFKRFYPASADYTVVDESIAELDLKGTVPHDVPSEPYGKHADDVGATIYPRAPTTDVRHYVRFFFTADGGTLLFALDQLSSGEVCLVRMQLPATSGSAMKQRCVAPETFGAHSLAFYDSAGDGSIENFVENNSGSLTLTVETESRSVDRSFQIDKNSLEAAELSNEVIDRVRALTVSWPVAKQGLITFVAPDLKSKDLSVHLQDAIKAVLIIDTAGNVREATVSGLPSSAAGPVKAAILKWKFKPTMLDGAPVEVSTAFSSSVGGLTRLP